MTTMLHFLDRYFTIQMYPPKEILRVTLNYSTKQKECINKAGNL